jgi:thiol-disulfide isomerase/thioredoxin
MKTSRLPATLVLGAFAIAAGLLVTIQAQAAKILDSRPAPQFTQTSPEAWFNSSPLTRDVFKGKVTLVDFWTFGCWNCYRSFPWLLGLEARMQGKDFQVIGIHTPEFDHEKVRANVEKKIAEFELTHPVMMDNDFAYWNAYGNRYWPAFYLVDKQGMIRHRFAGETHAETGKARAIEAAIEALLKE